MREETKNNIMFLAPLVIIILVFFPVILYKNIKYEEKMLNSEENIQRNNEDIKKLKNLIDEKRIEIENAEIKIKMLENEKSEILISSRENKKVNEEDKFIKISSQNNVKQNNKQNNKQDNKQNYNGRRGSNQISKTDKSTIVLETEKAYNGNGVTEIPVRRIGERIESYELYWPIDSRRITSHFGTRQHPILNGDKFHRGVDIAANKGESVKSGMDGVITYSGEKGNYGYLVEIERRDGLKVRYAHLSKIFVSFGDIVKIGQKIGEVGSTGMSTGPHLHYEVLVEEIPVDPMKFKYVEIFGEYGMND